MLFDPDILIRALNDKRPTACAMRERLRALVNEWIDSGKNGDLDTPKCRRLSLSSAAYKAADGWLQQNRLREYISPTGDVSSRFRFADPSDSNGNDDTSAVRRADGRFFSLMQSPLKFSIARCERCNDFFFRKKLRAYYNRGSFCIGCRRAAAAKRKTYADRDALQNAALKAAAAAWSRWASLSAKSQARHGSREGYALSKIVNTGKTAKWITRNRAEIDRRAQGVS